MKKILLATTALAAVSVVSVAQAQESNMMSAGGNTLNIGGYYEFGWASRSDDMTGDDRGADSYTYGDSELFIDFETTSDAGLTYGVQVDIELIDGNRHNIDENRLNAAQTRAVRNEDIAEEANIYISGDFGTINLGHDDFASDNFLVWAPTHEGTISQDDSIYYFRFVNGAALNGDTDNRTGTPSSNLRYFGNAASYDDRSKITYLSPNFGGFKFGGSFSDGQAGDEEYDLGFGASYTHDLSNMMEGASFSLKYAGQTNGEDNERVANSRDFVDGKKEVEMSSFGGSLGLGNLTLTASYYDGQNGDVASDTTEFGIGYVVSDRLSLGYSYATAEAEEERANDSNTVQEGTFHSASASYSIAPGLKTTLAYNISDITQKGRVATLYTNADGTTEENVTVGGVSNDTNEVVWQVEFSF